MIKGKTIKSYNEFEEEILLIVGDVSEASGLDFYFKHLNQTFDIAERAVKTNAEDYMKWFTSQELEIRQDIFHDVGHQFNSIALSEMLYKSYFVTVHGNIRNKYFPFRDFASLNDNFLSCSVVEKYQDVGHTYQRPLSVPTIEHLPRYMELY